MSIASRPGLVVSLVLGGVSLSAVAQAPGESPYRAIAVSITLNGSLDHATQVEEIRREIEAAKSGGTRLIGVEIAGTRWRYDIARSLSELVRASEPPVAVFVRDGSLGVVLGASKAAGGCWVPPGSLTMSRDDHAMDHAPHAKAINADAKAWAKSDAWSGFAALGPLRASMIDLRAPSWLIEDDKGALTIVGKEPAKDFSKDPAKDNAQPRPSRSVALVDGAAERINLSTLDAAALGIIAGEAKDLRDAMALAGKRIGIERIEVRRQRTCGMPLEDRHAAVVKVFESVDPILDQANLEQRLKIDDKKVAPATKNASGKQSLATLQRASAAIASVEQAILATPEILHLSAPGQTTTVTRRSSHAASWRAQIQTLRERRDKLQNHAEKLRDAK